VSSQTTILTTAQHKPDCSGNPAARGWKEQEQARSWSVKQEQTLIVKLALLFKKTGRRDA